MAEAGSFGEALAACRALTPDVALLGSSLASTDGNALLDELKADPDAYSTAIVVVAPPEMSAARAQDVLRRGAQDVLIEPITAADVIARVRSAARTKILQEELVGQSRRLETMLHERTPSPACSTAATC